MMVERLKHEGTLHSSSDLLKILVKMGMIVHNLGLVLFSFSASGRPGAPRLPRSELQVCGVAGGVNGYVERCPERVWGVFSNLQ